MKNTTTIDTSLGVLVPRLESTLGKLSPGAQSILADVFEKKQISTAGILKLIPRKNKNGMVFISTMTVLTKIFSEYGIMVKYVTAKTTSYPGSNNLTIEINTRTVIKCDDLPTSLRGIYTKKEIRRSDKNESVDFNELEKYVQVHFGNDLKENPDELFPEIDWYIETIKHHKILAKDVVYKLIEEAQQGNIHSQNTIIMHNQRLLLQIGARYKGRLGFKPNALEFEDVIQEGNFGIKRAIELFDPSLGFSFSTYAYNWISQTMGRAMADFGNTVRFPVHVHEKLSKFRKLFALMEARGEGKADFGEIAQKMDIKLDEVFNLEKLEHFKNGVSLDEPSSEDDNSEGSGLGDLIADKGSLNPAQMVDRMILKEKMRKSLKMNLSLKEFQIIDARYGLSSKKALKLQEIGNEFGVTRERIRQIQEIAMEKIRSDEGLRKYAEEYLEKQLPQIETEGTTQSMQHAQKAVETLKATKLAESVATLTISVVSKYYGIPEEEVRAGSRKEETVYARHIAMYILREHYKLSLSEIGRRFNEMDHTSIRHACLKMGAEADKGSGLANEVEFLTELLNSYKDMVAQSK